MADQTKLQQYADMQPFVQKDIQTMFESLYEQMASKYGVASVPLHRHNGADSPKIGDQSVTNFVTLPSVENGVLSVTNLGTQVVNSLALNPSGNQSQAPATVFDMPVPVIYASSGVGPGSSFNLGDAPQGTVIMFANVTAVTSNLWVKTLLGWYGFNASVGPL